MSERVARINEAMREVIGGALVELNDPRIGFVTITQVRVARDFRNAKVYVSVLGDERSREQSLAALRAAHGLLQRKVAREVRIHHTPQLEFVYDDTLDSALRIQQLLEQEQGETGQ